MDQKRIKRLYHTFHLVDPSPWPLFVSLSAFALVSGAALYFHSYKSGLLTLLLGFINLLLVISLWARDIIREGTYEGRHTKKVQSGLRLGMLLFIVSEIMFFFAFFWAYFHVSLAPSIQIGCIWPPAAIIPFKALGIPLYNTIILLSSGATVTAAHYFLINGEINNVMKYMSATIILAIFFTYCQMLEYMNSSFSIADGIYGSTFFLLTGFHGFHVIIGTILLILTLVRAIFSQFTKEHHFGFEASAWYWHFVDVVWLFLFIVVYCWGAAV